MKYLHIVVDLFVRISVLINVLIFRGGIGACKGSIIHGHSKQSIDHFSRRTMILVIVSFVGVEGICHFAVVDYTVSPALTVWILVLFIRPTAGSDRIAELVELARLFPLGLDLTYTYILVLFLFAVVFPCVFSTDALASHRLVCGHAKLKQRIVDSNRSALRSSNSDSRVFCQVRDATVSCPIPEGKTPRLGLFVP